MSKTAYVVFGIAGMILSIGVILHHGAYVPAFIVPLFIPAFVLSMMAGSIDAVGTTPSTIVIFSAYGIIVGIILCSLVSWLYRKINNNSRHVVK
jgi:uncharacterized protein YacL